MEERRKETARETYQCLLTLTEFDSRSGRVYSDAESHSLQASHAQSVARYKSYDINSIKE